MSVTINDAGDDLDLGPYLFPTDGSTRFASLVGKNSGDESNSDVGAALSRSDSSVFIVP